MWLLLSPLPCVGALFGVAWCQHCDGTQLRHTLTVGSELRGKHRLTLAVVAARPWRVHTWG